MSSNETPLPNQKIADTVCDVSDVTDLRDAGENVETTSAPPAGCRTDEAEPEPSEQTRSDAVEAEPAGCRPAEDEPKPADVADDGLLSVSAQGGSSDASLNEPKTPAESIKSVRDFEAFLRASGFSRADAKAIAKGGWPAIGEAETDAQEGLDEMLLARIDEVKSWFSVT